MTHDGQRARAARNSDSKTSKTVGKSISATGESVRTKGQLGRQDPGRGMRRYEEAPRPLTQTVHRGGKTKTLPDGFRLPHGQGQQSKDGTNNEDDRLKYYEGSVRQDQGPRPLSDGLAGAT
ncbi:hypothetical protein A4X13_0g3669 [Tilletia indica]|uniref:Uncharacterized protein n=1 Tax=Tilletia indica TaxID=43049 RepID=A0A8T8T2W1_9BASI|nr:hypothetical protein A4X13_0g3669 [Tilletia indica]